MHFVLFFNHFMFKLLKIIVKEILETNLFLYPRIYTNFRINKLKYFI